MRTPGTSFGGLFVCLLAIAVAATGASAAEIKALRVSDEAGTTRAVLELSGPLQYKLMTLQNPDRLVLDIDASTLAPGFKPVVGNGVLKGVRTGRQGKRRPRGLRPRKAYDPRVSCCRRPRSSAIASCVDHAIRTGSRPPAQPMVRTVRIAMPGDRNARSMVAIDAGPRR
jgi:N-acetylmuramoyl-L-alanine amidase